jgi:uncharacterized protein
MAARDLSSGRLPGLDLARAFAMLGMLVVHTRLEPENATERAFAWANVWTGPMFALVAGVGLSLAWAHRRTTRTRAVVVVRAAALLLIGVLLETQMFGSILQYFAVYFVVGLLALRLGVRALFAIAGTCLLVGPLVITYLVRHGTISLGERSDRGLEALADPVALLRALTIDGTYPAIVWGGFFFLGMALGRLDLRDPRVTGRMAVLGLAVGGIGTAVGWVGARTFHPDRLEWSYHWTTMAHSESVAWAIVAAGFAAGFTGAVLWIARRLGRRVGRLAPFIALGQIALTFYLLHLWYSDTLWKSIEPEVTSVPAYVAATLGFFVLFAAGAWAWRQVFWRGPVEGVIDVVARILVRPRPLPDRATGSALV